VSGGGQSTWCRKKSESRLVDLKARNPPQLRFDRDIFCGEQFGSSSSSSMRSSFVDSIGFNGK
jgi:hypothetical protein